ncbi:MAG TPA: M15 family metallopeptidase [Acidimicrobiia bacterium]|nr:M15 family metallopeptidase [Acidimicrobiia bacterium]
MTRLTQCALVVALVGLVVVGLAPAGHAAGGDPIDPANRPTPLAGEVNGLVSPSRLINVAPNCIAAREAAPSLARIFAMAREVNIPLGAEECYRTLAEELRLASIANQPANNPPCVATPSRSSSGGPVGTSFHGWGKAVDLTDAGGSLTFGSAGYAFMKKVAGSLGWNHPAFAEPGGSACPEPWHWEWVGDGGSLGASPRRGDAVALLPSADDHGYASVTGLGAVTGHGDFVNYGSAAGITLSWVVVGAATTPARSGYWLVGADGGVFTFGNARFHGSTGGLPLWAPVNSITPTHSGNGYWLVAWDGGIFSFGDARFHGSMGGKPLVAPVDGMTPTNGGNGYWLVAGDGGIFSFGDARFHGSMGGTPLVAPVVGIARTRSGNGYWLVASDGGVFSFGDAKFYGSLGGTAGAPVVGMVPTTSGHGYWIERADATVAAFGDAVSYGSG